MRNLTYNATDYNNLYFTFSQNTTEFPAVRTNKNSPFFQANIGLVPKEIWIEEEDEEIQPARVEEPPPTIYKHVTFNEWLIIWAVMLALIFYVIKQKYCLDSCKQQKNTNYNQWQNTKKVIEELIEVNNPPDPWGGIGDETDSKAPVIKFVAGGQSNKIGVITSVADSMAQLKGSRSPY